MTAVGNHRPMDPVTVGAFVSAANASIKLAQAVGLVRDEARDLSRDTNKTVKALLTKDFDVALSMLETTGHALNAERQRHLLAKAADRFEDAEATSELDEHFRAFAAAMCAALAIRIRSDGEEARHWAVKAARHYDRGLRDIHKRARKAARSSEKATRWGRRAGVVPP